MLKQLKRFTQQIIAGANVATILLMIAVGYSDRLNPADFPRLANVGLAFPVFVVLTLGFLVFWLIFKPRYTLFSLVGMLLAFSPVRTYCPLNIPRTLPDSTLQVVSFNAYNCYNLDNFKQQVLDFLNERKADIVCLQELVLTDADKQALAANYPYCDTCRVLANGDVLTVLSRYPIISREWVPNHHDLTGATDSLTLADAKTHHSQAFFVLVEGDTVCVINNHLESTHLTQEQRDNFKRIVKNIPPSDSVETESKQMLGKLSESVAARALQADALARYISLRLQGEAAAQGDTAMLGARSVLLCGDFNDGPISYARRTIARELTDCFRESGNGPGISYHHYGFFFRIDHMMCSTDWVPIKCIVDSKINISDHYPVICWLKKRSKP